MSELSLHRSRLDNRYDILDVLGRGSYAELYVARDSRAPTDDPHHHVVIKALNPHLQGETDAELERTLLDNFRNEAVALDRVRHPNIISRLGHGTAIDLGGRTFHYIVLEYLPGGDLAALCRRQPLTLEQTLFYLEQTCAGLSHAHSQGVIHRDIKPHNLLLTADRRTIKITDFGVAKIKVIAAAEGAITRVGTDVYAAPEHHPLMQTGPLVTRPLALPGHLTPAADVYSLAKTTYMLLTGEAPRRFAQRTITDFPPPIAQEAWADDVLAVLARATRISPAERTQTVDDFWRELSAAGRYVGGFEVPDNLRHAPPAALPFEAQSARPTRGSAPDPPRDRQHDSAPPPRVTDGRQRIVVDISHPSDSPHGSAAYAGGGAVEYASQPAAANAKYGARGRSFTSRLKLWAVALGIVLAFAGMLYATYQWVNRSSSRATTSAADARAVVGREFVTMTDVNLRSGPNAGTRQVGIAEREARVLDVNEDWYEVRIVERGPAPREAGAQQGWLNSKFLSR